MEAAMRLRLVALTAVLLVPLAACHRPAGTRSDHHETRSFAAAPGKLVRLDLRSLDAEVEVVTGESIDVEVRLEAHSSSRAAAQRWIERNTPVMDDSPSRLEITVPKRSGVSVIGFIATEGTVHVKLPAQCMLEVRTASGDVSLSGEGTLSTPVRVDTTSGDVTVRGGTRELLLDTSSGDIRVTGAALAVLEANTSSGDVQLDSGAGRAVIETASGDAALRNLAGDLSATSSSGDVEARWSRLPAGARVRIETASGEVTLRMPAAVPLTGEVRTSSGRIQSDFPGAEDRRGRRFTLPGAAAGPPESAAAGAELSIKTVSGDVTLVKTKLEL
jgi:DUF4097 and DUF4098 domain-containing protein YvlB